jgi:MFS family permease
MINWNPPFYIRVHELGTAEVGTFIGLLAGIAGGLGTVLGGTIADRLGTRDTRWYMWLPGVAMLLSVPAALAQYLVADAYVSFAIAGASYFLLSVYIGPFIATAQSLVVASMRATTQAVILMVFNIFGLSLGPFFTGMLSDALNFQAGLGADSLRYALCLAVLFNLWAAFHFIRGAVFLRADMERDRSRDGG